ncbi:MAG TPA: hypothetical protein HPP87_11110 [Planctomycetes bacterium]|nr:hypothetical protein [Planctomycetota bacterium]
MSFSDTNSALKLPEGYVAIPVSEDQKSAVLKICVLAKQQADTVGGHLVLIRDTINAKVYLGCTVDAGGDVLEWLELWIQCNETLINTVSAARQSLSNRILDDRWRRQVEAFEKLDKAAAIKTGMETSHPLPTFLDINAPAPIHPKDADSGSHWQLCTDEGLLGQKGLGGYGDSLHRYLHLPTLGSESHLVPLTSEAPTNSSTKPMSEIGLDTNRMVPFNAAAGFMMVRKHAPIGLETFIDILSNASWDGLKHGASLIDLGDAVNGLKKDDTAFRRQGRLFLESHGICGRLVETFHLKLRLLADIVSSVHSIVRHLQQPLLNINPDNWRVSLGRPGRGLPFLWTARAELARPGDAVPLAIERSDRQYYLPSLAVGTSVYRPLITSLPTKGRASIRIRQVLPDTGDTTILEGTFSTQERINIASCDIVWLRINLAHRDIDLYAHLEADSAMAQGEWRFRTIGQFFDDAQTSALRPAEGVPMSDIPFEIIPLLSSPCDLYSLAVMAARILLVDNTNSLPVALDEMLSLAKQTNSIYDENISLDERIKDIFASDSRWIETLGPQHLIFDRIAPQEALSLVTGKLWWETLAMVVRMFPGLGNDSECIDYGDARQGGLHKVFERTIADLDGLILKTRSLIVADWKSNYEICNLIDNYLE